MICQFPCTTQPKPSKIPFHDSELIVELITVPGIAVWLIPAVNEITDLVPARKRLAITTPSPHLPIHLRTFFIYFRGINFISQNRSFCFSICTPQWLPSQYMVINAITDATVVRTYTGNKPITDSAAR